VNSFATYIYSPVGSTLAIVVLCVLSMFLIRWKLMKKIIGISVVGGVAAVWGIIFYFSSTQLIRERSWFDNTCYLSSSGWKSIYLLSQDGKQLADKAIGQGDLRLMFAYGRGPAISPNASTKSTRRNVVGLNCETDVDVRPPIGEAVYGDFLQPCRLFYREVQLCVAWQYNQEILGHASKKIINLCESVPRAGC